MATEKYTGRWPDWVTLTGEIIAQNAKQSAWPYGTAKSKRTYVKSDKLKNNKQYGKFYENIQKAFPNRAKTWGHQPACGASCDVFASTSVVSTGYDKKVPRGLGGRGKGQYKHFAESPLWKDVKAYKAKDRKAGDYILYLNKTTGGHACIAGGNGYTYEAGYRSKRYGCTVKATNYNPSSKAIIGIYRPTKALRKYLKKGDVGLQTKRIQLFLQWAGFLDDKVDGIFGHNTEVAVKAFQLACDITPDGQFGEVTLKKAQEWTIETPKEYYTGEYPHLDTITNRERVYNEAIKLAYPKGTSKAKTSYPNGKPKAEYKTALDKAYPKRATASHWDKAQKAGASCGVFTGVVISVLGIKKNFPHYTAKQWAQFENTDIWESVSVDKAQQGDIFIYKHTDGGGHTGILGKGNYVLEASHGDFYPKTTSSKKARLSPKNKKKLRVYRAKGNVVQNIKYGSTGDDVIRLQKYLEWYGSYDGHIDGECGNGTVNAILQFQKDNGLVQDKIWGVKCNAKAKTIKK